ncbi:MAG: hydroxymethylbilane synthase [Chloroflexi bacterium]|nr:MAG: hydroxymethylbilane synthase [Chloroflexota bacterium]
MPPLRLGTRGSALARRQTELVAEALSAAGVDSEPLVIHTTGDRNLSASLLEIGGQGVFVREIEQALVEGRVDVAVHSAKDMPGELLPGTTVGATLPRADVRDVLVGSSLAGLAPGARVGTGSRRRVAQLLAARPDVVPAEIRGNVDTRLRKLSDGDYDAVILAAAGLERLGRAELVAESLPIDLMLPSPGQGVIALQVRDDDAATVAVLAAVDHAPTSTALRAERALLQTLGAGCSLPVAALAHLRANEVLLLTRVLDSRGEQWISVQESGPAADPEAVGRRAGEGLLARGARELLQEFVS